MATQRVQHALVEDLGHQSHVLVHDDAGAVADGDPGRLLAPVLERVEAVVGELAHLLAGRPYAEDSTGILRATVVRIEVVGQPSVSVRHAASLGAALGSFVPGRPRCPIPTLLAAKTRRLSR